MLQRHRLGLEGRPCVRRRPGLLLGPLRPRRVSRGPCRSLGLRNPRPQLSRLVRRLTRQSVHLPLQVQLHLEEVRDARL